MLLYDKKISSLLSGLVKEGEGRLTLKEPRQDFKITSFKPFKEAYLFSFEGVKERQQSELLKGKKLFISKDLVDSFNVECENSGEVLLSGLLDYSFYNKGERLGVVSGFLETKAHDLLQVKLLEGGGLVEIPWVSEFLMKIDQSLKRLYFKAPPELLDLNFLNPQKKQKTKEKTKTKDKAPWEEKKREAL